ncbi:YigZ family protein [Desulfotalea psychrophila]|uniref:Impact N-terminal domain-containing protein n=1 Tax=Desulfotalea psychrophila (strain LSv54 / DSM 12343) TaxID=177439 RepID=Q6AQE2_DESPS|nr:YigZ family protein [Desulfotalea psychrophila]CAG35431.1 conserved hypothetical protein [Desulfotalea psychrophila LSv54]
MQSYPIPAHEHQTTDIVKKSQFICYISHCPEQDIAQDFIKKIQCLHPTASHNCWAYVAGKPTDPSCWGMNDNGEPKGCAGKPMFNVIHHSGIGEICAVVSRYFGGTKLGTGGMARAYSGAVQHALAELKTRTKHSYQRVALEFSYPLQQAVNRILTEYEAESLSTDYGALIKLSTNLRLDSFSECLCQLRTLEHQGLSINKDL